MRDTDLCLLLVDGVIAVALVEAAGLALWHAFTRRGPAPATLAANLGAGLCLLGALHDVLAGAGWPRCALWLAAAGVAHAADLLRRWRLDGSRPPSELAESGYRVHRSIDT